jgi:hypothetical protein
MFQQISSSQHWKNITNRWPHKPCCHHTSRGGGAIGLQFASSYCRRPEQRTGSMTSDQLLRRFCCLVFFYASLTFCTLTLSRTCLRIIASLLDWHSAQ